MKAYRFFPPLCLLILLLSFSLAASAFGQNNSAGLVMKDVGSLGNAVNENKFKTALGAWVRHCNQLIERFKALPPEKADKLFIEGNTLRDLQHNSPLDSLDQSIHPVLERLMQHYDENKLSANDRKVIALVQQYGVNLGNVEGSIFLEVDEAFFTKMLAPFLSPAASAYLAVKDSQPQNFFYSHGCYYPHGDMGDYAVAWEKFLNSQPAGVYAQDAAKRYQSIMEYLLFGEAGLAIQPAFYNGKMHEGWLDGLQGIVVSHPQSQSGTIVSEYLAAIKADGYTLTPAVKRAFKGKITAVCQPASSPKPAQASGSAEAERKLVGKHMFSLQWISHEKFGTAIITCQDSGRLYINARQELNGDYVTLKGDVNVIDAKEFTVTGELVTRVSYNNGGEACPRNGTFTFKATGTRKYWRMQEMTNPCEDIVDYVDIYF